MSVTYVRGEDNLLIPFSAAFERMEPNRADDLRGMPILLNLDTLVRNAVHSLESYGSVEDVKADFRHTLVTELMMLEDRFARDFEAKLVPFRSGYGWLKSPPSAIAYAPRTEKQKTKHDLETIGKQVAESLPCTVFTRGLVPTTDTRRAVVITHIAADLLNGSRFNSLKLFESHTGEVKSRERFNNKLNLNKEQRNYIPLNRITMAVFGDGTIYNAMDKSVRKKLCELAQKSRWTPMTTEDRVLSGLKTHEPMLYPMLSELR